MIAGLNGVIAEKTEKSVLIDVQGVRYDVNMSTSALSHLPSIGHEVEIWTRLVSTDDALTLYGFASQLEQRLFDLLVTVTGVGPRLALNILTAGPMEEIIAAISQEQPEYFLKVGRLGKKTAGKIILDLKSKIDENFPARADQNKGAVTSGADMAVQALVDLGYSVAEAKEALRNVESKDLSDRVREALKNLSAPAIQK